MRNVHVGIPFRGLEGKQSCDVQFIQHRDGTESVICRTVMENGRKAKFVAKLRLLPEKDCNGHEWNVSCLGMSTHSYSDKSRWLDALDMFRFWLSVFTSMIRDEDTKVRAGVRV